MPMTLTRSLLTVILPGMVAVAPWLLVAMMSSEDLRHWYAKFPIPFHVAAFGVAVLAGSVFEEIGCYLERLWDSNLGNQDRPHLDPGWLTKDWYTYLGQTFGGAEPVGYRYASRKVTALYFEMAMMFAAPCCFVGFSMLIVAIHGGVGVETILLFCLALLSWYLFGKMARDTHLLLAELRHFLPRHLQINR